VYYDLLARREQKKFNNIAFIRLEQLAPFPFHQVAEEAKKFPNAEAYWCQEEPMNMGGYGMGFNPQFMGMEGMNNMQNYNPYMPRTNQISGNEENNDN